MKHILPVVLMIFTLFTACKDSGKKSVNTVKDDLTKDAKGTAIQKPSGDFDIDPPKGWEKVDTIMEGKRIIFLRSPLEGKGDDFRENVNVLTEKVYGMGMAEYVDRNIESMKSGLTGFSKGRVRDRTINGMEFTSLKYSHSYYGTIIDAEVYFTIIDKTAYVITCSAKGGSIEDWEPEFEEAVGSFHFH